MKAREKRDLVVLNGTDYQNYLSHFSVIRNSKNYLENLEKLVFSYGRKTFDFSRKLTFLIISTTTDASKYI